jgi:hypothetical protein
MANPITIVLSIHKAATAIAYMAANLKQTKMLIAVANMGRITYLKPKANPNITLVSPPTLHESTTSWTGLRQKYNKGH